MSSVTDVNNTIIQNQRDTAVTQAEERAKTGGTKELDQNAFLQLLIAQMKYQDPTNPTDSSQFLTQSAQFTQVEQMIKLNQSNSFAQASDLIGKTVTLNDSKNENAAVKGVVTEAKISKDGTSVVIDGKEYLTKDITSVKDTATSNGTSAVGS